MFESLRHLLPDSPAWRVVKQRLLRNYLAALASVGTDTQVFLDDVSDDLYPPTTRELEEWEKQFGLNAVGTDAARRLSLAAAWAATGGQSPGYLQDIIRTAGFAGAYVYDSFDLTDVSLSQFDRTYDEDTNQWVDQTYVDFVDQLDTALGFCFGAGGRNLYLAGEPANSVFQYSLLDQEGVNSSPYDLRIVSHTGQSFDVTTENTSIVDVQVSTDGTKMFVLGQTAPGSIFEYDLDPAFDISTAVLVDDLDVSSEEDTPFGFAWHPEGTEVYVTGTEAANVHQYNLGTAWDISTATFDSTFATGLTTPVAVAFTHYGTSVLVLDGTDDIVTQFDLSVAYDLSTAGAAVHTLDLGVTTTPVSMKIEHGHIFVSATGSETRFDRYTYGGAIDPNDYTNKPLFGLTQCGDDGTHVDGLTPIAECGEQPDDQDTLLSAVCDRFLANEVWYLWNNMLTNAAPPAVPDEPSTWPHFWYVGGTPFGTELDMPSYDRARFEELCLKLGPTEQWIVTMLDVTDYEALGPFDYDDSATFGADTRCRYNSTTLGSITVCRLGYNDTDAVNHEAFYATIESGDTIRMAWAEFPDQWIDMDVTGTATDGDPNDYWGVPVTSVTASAAWTGFPANLDPVIVYFG